jgi:pilus assembly protein Flp/PilA
VKTPFARFAKDESCATAILIASLIAVALIVGTTAVGNKLNTTFIAISNKIDGL